MSLAATYFRTFKRACADNAPLLARRDALFDGMHSYKPDTQRGNATYPDNGMAARADAIARIDTLIGDNLATINEGLAVIDGISAALGERYAAVMFNRYYKGDSWHAVASKVGMSERWCYQAEAVCIGYVDSVGIKGAREARPIPCGDKW